ncbi:MAG: Type 1 glutamine amidotransferase-like domain-containing protein [Bacteroidota bacterium]
MSSRILAFSSSRVSTGGYLESAAPVIKNFLGDTPLNIAFIPFAGVAISYEEYTQKVREGLAGLGHNIITVSAENAKAEIGKADVIMVGGGNTFSCCGRCHHRPLNVSLHGLYFNIEKQAF